jgi:hypothetical protein
MLRKDQIKYSPAYTDRVGQARPLPARCDCIVEGLSNHPEDRSGSGASWALQQVAIYTVAITVLGYEANQERRRT